MPTKVTKPITFSTHAKSIATAIPRRRARAIIGDTPPTGKRPLNGKFEPLRGIKVEILRLRRTREHAHVFCVPKNRLNKIKSHRGRQYFFKFLFGKILEPFATFEDFLRALLGRKVVFGAHEVRAPNILGAA